MFLKEFNQSPTQKVGKLNKLLSEQFGMKIPTNGLLSEKKLRSLHEEAKMALVQLRQGGKKFQLEPEYAKYLGIRDITETLLNEGIWANSPAMIDLKSMITQTVRELMDLGYTDDEASKECMNRVRMGPHAWDDSVTLPMVLQAAKQYVEDCNSTNEEIEGSFNAPDLGLNERLMSALAEEMGVDLADIASYDAISEKLDAFAEVSGRSRDAVVGFLNGLDEDSVASGIQLFGRKIAEANKLTDSIKYMHRLKANGKSVAQIAKELNMEPSEVEDALGKTAVEEEELEESLFDELLDGMLNEAVDVEQAEVVIAVRALADDIQDMVERMGRMVNEDIPAIADQMRAEMGASTAQAFTDTMISTLTAHMEATRQIKATVDQQVGTLTGDEAPADMGAEDPMGAAMPAADVGTDMDAMGAEEPVADMPAEDPMGRAAV